MWVGIREGPGRALSEGERWFVVHSMPHRESGAKGHLENQDYRTFLPRRLKTRLHARKLETVLAPFFPRYLFVALDLCRDHWRSVNGTFGVSRLIMEGERPQPVPRGVVEALVAASDARDVLRFDVGGHLNVGERVQVLAGPFADQFGVLERLGDHGRVRLLLEIMGGCVPVEMSSEILIPAA